MFTLPLIDDVPTRRVPYLTWTFIVLNVVIFLWQLALPAEAERALIYALGVVPATLLGDAALPPEIQLVPPWASILTSQFLHGSLLHLGGNMLYLWIFGNNVEDAMGPARFVVFYLLCGAAAALIQSFTAPDSTIPMIGASGAIAGILGAYILLHPHANVRMLLVILLFIRIVSVPAVLVLGLWFAMQFFAGWMTPATDDQGGVAYWAHAGGFIIGMGLIPIFKERGIALFSKGRSRSFQSERFTGLRRHKGGSVPPSGNDRKRGPWG